MSLYPTDATSPVVLEKTIWTHVVPMDDDGCQAIAIGHLSNSGDLKRLKFYFKLNNLIGTKNNKFTQINIHYF